MYPKWKVYYADGTSFPSEEGNPNEAPGLGVIVIVQEHHVKGERPYLQHMTDYYIWLGNRWLGCDLFRLWQYVFVEKYKFSKVALAGQTVTNVEFLAIRERAKKQRDKWHDSSNL